MNPGPSNAVGAVRPPKTKGQTVRIDLVDQAGLEHREIQLTAAFQQEVGTRPAAGASEGPRPSRRVPNRRGERPRSGRTAPAASRRAGGVRSVVNTSFSVSGERKKFIPARFSGKIEQTVMFRGWGEPLAAARRSRTAGSRMIEGGSFGTERAAADQHAVGQGAERFHLGTVFGAAEVDLTAVDRGELAVGRLGDVQGHERPPGRGGAAGLGHCWRALPCHARLVIAGERTEIRADVVIIFVLGSLQEADDPVGERREHDLGGDLQHVIG